MEAKIITLDDIREYWPVSTNLHSDKVDSAILRAQQTDLERLLGYFLYYDFINDYDGSNFQQQKYIDLFDGTEYEYRSNTRYFRGVRHLLSVYAFVRVVDVSGINVTQTGMVDKLTEESESKEDNQIRSARWQAKDDATRLEADTVCFIESKKDDYPLYWQVFSTDKGRDRTAFNFYPI